MTESEKPAAENPYATPMSVGSGPTTHAHGSSGTWVRQVRIVAVLMAVQGVLEFLFGLYFVAMGFFFPSLMAMQQNQTNQMPAGQAQMVSNILFTVFVVGGCVVVFLGVLRVIAGILGFNFKGRGLGIASHFLGLLSIFSFYCIVTGLPLCIYGCMVYFNSDVKRAFEMRREGQPVDQVLSQFH